MDKRSIIALICCFMLVAIGITGVSFGEGTTTEESIKYVKVGLNYPITSDKEINMYSDDGFSIKLLKDEFEEIMKLDNSKITVRLDYYFEDKEIETGKYHIELQNTYETYETANKMKGLLEGGNIFSHIVHIDGVYKLWVGQYSTEEKAISQMAKLSNRIQIEMTVVNAEQRMMILEDEKGNTILSFEDNSRLYIGEVDKEIEDSIVGVGDRSYRSFITFTRRADKLNVINYINLEKYLYGVVPREMSGSWAIEALKAQAVAARNYAILSIGKHWKEGYDLCDTTHCQVYAGYNWEKIRSNTAVDETKGKLIKYDGKIISTFYHSSSGGRTENSENVWSFPVPYLRGVKDIFSEGAPNSNWTLVLTNEGVQKKLANHDINVGEITSIKPLEYSENDRVLKLAINGTDSTHILEKDGARKVLGYNSLKSTMFNTKSDGEVYIKSGKSSETKKVTLGEASIITANGIEVANKSSIVTANKDAMITNGKDIRMVPVIPTTYTFNGSGWGHGLGMSQWGAKKMAEIGYNYEQILEHYYRGAKVE